MKFGISLESVSEVFNLGSCEDLFCRDCCETFAGDPCPKCGVTSHAKDAAINRQLSLLTSLCGDLWTDLQTINSGEQTTYLENTDSVQNIDPQLNPDFVTVSVKSAEKRQNTKLLARRGFSKNVKSAEKVYLKSPRKAVRKSTEKSNKQRERKLSQSSNIYDFVNSPTLESKFCVKSFNPSQTLSTYQRIRRKACHVLNYSPRKLRNKVKVGKDIERIQRNVTQNNDVNGYNNISDEINGNEIIDLCEDVYGINRNTDLKKNKIDDANQTSISIDTKKLSTDSKHKTNSSITASNTTIKSQLVRKTTGNGSTLKKSKLVSTNNSVKNTDTKRRLLLPSSRRKKQTQDNLRQTTMTQHFGADSENSDNENSEQENSDEENSDNENNSTSKACHNENFAMMQQDNQDVDFNKNYDKEETIITDISIPQDVITETAITDLGDTTETSDIGLSDIDVVVLESDIDVHKIKHDVKLKLDNGRKNVKLSAGNESVNNESEKELHDMGTILTTGNMKENTTSTKKDRRSKLDLKCLPENRELSQTPRLNKKRRRSGPAIKSSSKRKEICDKVSNANENNESDGSSTPRKIRKISKMKTNMDDVLDKFCSQSVKTPIKNDDGENLDSTPSKIITSETVCGASEIKSINKKLDTDFGENKTEQIQGDGSKNINTTEPNNGFEYACKESNISKPNQENTSILTAADDNVDQYQQKNLTNNKISPIRENVPKNKKAKNKKVSELKNSPCTPRRTSSRARKTQDEKNGENLNKSISNTPTSTRGRNAVVTPVSRAVKAGLMSPKMSPVFGLKSPSQASVVKRNAKGETPLHVAAIKGNVELVKKLLEDGANPNVQDHAGWTVLHEACNHGHVPIARLLLQHGAMVNVPGSGNDSPLHDAVCNRHIECAKLLVEWGASLTARNTEGLTPEDYAVTDSMKAALSSQKKVPQTTDEVAKTCDISEFEEIIILGTSLTREQRAQLQKCAGILHATVTDDYGPQVSHIVTSCNDEGQCPRTLKYLQAVLAGRWIVNMQWVQACLEYGLRVSEEAFEVRGTSTNPHTDAPLKGRLNRSQQLPGLFDGCSFYFHGPFKYPTPNAEELSSLVKRGGGSILTREPKLGTLDAENLTVPYHATPGSRLVNCGVYVVYDTEIRQRVTDSHMYTLPASWLMNSIASFRLLDPPFS